jgi:hypothetical protein
MTTGPLLFEISLTMTTDDARLLRKLLDLGLTIYLAKATDSRSALQLVVTVADKLSVAFSGDVGRHPL